MYLTLSLTKNGHPPVFCVQLSLMDQSASQTPTLPVTPQAIRPRRPSLLLILLIFSSIVVSLIFIILLVIDRSAPLLSHNTKPPVVIPTPTPYIPPPQKHWVLKKTSGSGPVKVLSLSEFTEQIAYSGDYLYYSPSESADIRIDSYNFKTGKITTIYDITKRKDFSETRSGGRDISDLQVIDNTLYFSIGGYLLSGATFWTNLPSSGTIHKLTSEANGRIQFWKNHYWLISGEGDACWGFSSYDLLNTKTKSVFHIADSSVGCNEGEAVIDIDNHDRFITAFHTASDPESDNNSDGVYQYVSLIPIADPKAKQLIISKKSMPSDITSIKYLPDSDQLFLSGTDKYLYDFSTKQLAKTNLDVPEVTPSANYTPKTTKDIINNIKLPEGYQFFIE